MVISNIQRLDIITTLEKQQTIQLSLQNRIMTLEDKDFANSENPDSDPTDSISPPAPKGDKLTRSFIPHNVSSKAQLADIIKSINSLGAHIIDLDATVDHVADNVKNQSTAISASISSIQNSQTALSQRLTTLEAN